MRPKIKIRSWRDWRLDVDYVKSLSPEHREFLLKFLDNHYQGANHEGVQSLQQNRESWRSTKSQLRDLMNNLQNSPRPTSTKARRFGPEDYQQALTSPEDAILELIDTKDAA